MQLLFFMYFFYFKWFCFHFGSCVWLLCLNFVWILFLAGTSSFLISSSGVTIWLFVYLFWVAGRLVLISSSLNLTEQDSESYINDLYIEWYIHLLRWCIVTLKQLELKRDGGTVLPNLCDISPLLGKGFVLCGSARLQQDQNKCCWIVIGWSLKDAISKLWIYLIRSLVIENWIPSTDLKMKDCCGIWITDLRSLSQFNSISFLPSFLAPYASSSPCLKGINGTELG